MELKNGLNKIIRWHQQIISNQSSFILNVHVIQFKGVLGMVDAHKHAVPRNTDGT